MVGGRARDLELIDALDALERDAFEGHVWRITREGRDPLLGSPVAARWDLGSIDVIYTSLERHGALSEIGFHLSRQPVFPTRLRSLIHQLRVKTACTLKVADLTELAALGVAIEEYKLTTYSRTQEIGDAAAFLGYDGMLVPSARWNGTNLVLFTDQLEPGDISVLQSDVVDWEAWKAEKAT
jgi:hypothetical protein